MIKMDRMQKRDPMIFLQEMLANAMDQGDGETVYRVSCMIDELTASAAIEQEDGCDMGRGA